MKILITTIATFIMTCFIFGGLIALDEKVTQIDNSSLLLKEISELTIENKDKGITIINQAEMIKTMADEPCYCE